MHPLKVQAVYQDTGVPAYKGNPFIEALPPLLEAFIQRTQIKSIFSQILLFKPIGLVP